MRFVSYERIMIEGINNTSSIVLNGARVVRADRVEDHATIHIEGDLISRIITGAHEETNVAAGPIIDLQGLTLFPGFIDVHIHGAVGVDTLEATTDDLRRVAKFLASRGVTAWLPTLVPAPAADYRRAVASIETLIREQRRDEEANSRASVGATEETEGAGNEDALGAVGARALGVHYEGPFVNSSQCGALRTEFFRTFKDASSLDELAKLSVELASPDDSRAAHMITVAPEIEGGIALVRELVSRGWIVSVGHTRADLHVLEAARAAGARHMTHFFNAMSPLHQRAPGPVGWGLMSDDVTCDIIADGVHCDPLMLRLALRCKTAHRLALISDAVLPAGLGDGDFEVWGETINVTGGRTRNARGAIAGSVITMLDAARTMLSLDCSHADVARMASLNPARLVGVEHLCGSIEEGKRADLVALDDGGRVRLTLVGGRIAFMEMPTES
ncbi:MAG: N-acetylglucosamine-6-phosphate deacetylase [Acidobacteriota bacterium]|nr:N-acetylglucosamine-6-phosphate deacetylase [Acidobacteriota bacterium]